MSFNYASLITDRTQTDVDALKALVKKPMSQWTVAEAEAFTAATLKGSYDYTDLNRVSACMEDLVARLNGLGYQVPGYERVKIERTVKPSSRLPEGYTEVQYIQSSGTQYMNTKFNPNQDTRVDIVCEPMESTAWTAIFGARTSSGVDEFCVDFTSTTQIRAFYGANYATSSISTMQTLLNVAMDKNVCTVNGQAITCTKQTFQTTFPLWLFAKNNGGSTWGLLKMKLYSCQIYDEGTMERDYVPCINASGEAGLYDLVTKTFFGNAGTGSFTAGSAVTGEVVAPSDSDEEELDPYLWYPEDAPTQPQIEQYRGNVAAVRAVLAMPDTVPETPETLRKPHTYDANNIEAILIAIDQILTHIPAARRHCGVTVCGLKGVIA